MQINLTPYDPINKRSNRGSKINYRIRILNKYLQIEYCEPFHKLDFVKIIHYGYILYFSLSKKKQSILKQETFICNKIQKITKMWL